MKSLSTADLVVVGEALFGPRWKSLVARELGIPRRTFMRWLSDGADLELEHLLHLRMLLRQRLAGLEDARKLLWSKLAVR